MKNMNLLAFFMPRCFMKLVLKCELSHYSAIDKSLHHASAGGDCRVIFRMLCIFWCLTLFFTEL